MSTAPHPDMAHQDQVKRLREMIRGIDVAMLVTETADGTLRSRPMATHPQTDDDELWFFTDIDSAKVFEIQRDRQVNVAYVCSKTHRYVSISGTATLSTDRKKMRELWGPFVQSWYPEGPEDPRVALIRVHPVEGEYWDVSKSMFVRVAELLKAWTIGTRPDVKEHGKVPL